jgi:hypothetical protein
MLAIEPHLIKIRMKPLYIIAAIFFLFVLAIPNKPEQVSFKNGLLLGALLFFILIGYLLSKTTIVLENNGLTISRIFSKTTTLFWNEIRVSKLSWQVDGGHTANIYWQFIADGNKKISIQPSFYTRKDLRMIAELLIEKSPGAKIDPRIRKIADGKFPWYLF